MPAKAGDHLYASSRNEPVIMTEMNPISYPESRKILQQLTDKLRAGVEMIPAKQALGRVLSTAVFARRANPPQAVAAMDGIAVNCAAIPDALVRLRKEQWCRINTGDLLPESFNAVIKIEDVQWEEEVPVLTMKPALYQNIRRSGEDFENESLLLVAEHQLQPQDISLLLAAGCDPVEVYKKPVVTFIPTGSEFVSQDGKFVESNSAMIQGLVESWGGELRVSEPVPDEPDDLAQILKFNVQNSDILVISAGTSLGTKDITSTVIGFMGKVHFHGVQISPGKPVMVGVIENRPVLGLPGYPAAAFVCSYLFLRNLVCALSHVRAAFPRAVYISAEDIPGKNQDSFYRVNCFDVDGQIFVRRIEGGAGSIGSTAQMDGLMHVPPNTPIRKRDGVRIDVIRERAADTITARGIRDAGLDQLFLWLEKSLFRQRFLFWESSVPDALQSIVERSLHVATINTPSQGTDPFEKFSKQLQETMHRYRVFTRTAALILRQQDIKSLMDLPSGSKIAIPTSKQDLWNSVVSSHSLAPDHFQIVDPLVKEQHLLEALTLYRWDAVFTDIRFLKQETHVVLETKEHVDLVIPDSYMELPAIRKLMELLLSEEYWMWIETQKGCDVKHTGLVAQ